MAASVVQSAVGRVANGTSIGVTLNGVASGNALIVVLSAYAPSFAVAPSVADDKGNSYPLAVSVNGVGGLSRIDAYAAFNVTGGNVAITVTLPSGAYAVATFFEVAGAGSVNPVDVVRTAGPTPSNAPSSGAFRPLVPSGLVVGGFLTPDNSADLGIDTPPGYTMLGVEQDSSVYIGHATAVRYFSAPANETINFGPLNSSVNWNVIGFFLADAGVPRYVGGTTSGFVGGTGTANISLTGLTGGIASAPAAGDIVMVGYAVGTRGRNPTLSITGNQSGAYVSQASLNEPGGTTYDARLEVFTQVMGATPDTQITRSGTGDAADGGAIIVHVWRGLDTTTLDAVTTTATGTGTARPNPPAITPVSNGAIVSVFGGGALAAGTVAFISSDLARFLNANGADTNDGQCGGGQRIWAAGDGAFDPAQWTGSGTQAVNSWAAVTMAYRPPPPPPPSGRRRAFMMFD